jgi:hypothetical protein
VFPNPVTSGNFNVEAAFNMESVVIYSLTGTAVYQQKILNTNKSHVYVELNEAIYLVKVIGAEQESMTRLIVY